MAKKPTTPTESSGDVVASFEEDLAKLDSIIRQLEDGRPGLSQSLALYESAVALVRRCHEALHTAQRRIELLTGVDAQGEGITAPFDDRQSSLDEPETRAAHRGYQPTDKTSRRLAADDVDGPTRLF
jgi:exodeoxyribonuclease VII small subunit